METLEKKVSGLSFKKAETVAKDVAGFVRDALETSGVPLVDAGIVADVRQATESLVRAGAFAGLVIGLDTVQVALKADYWDIDAADDRDVHLLKFLSKAPERISLSMLFQADQALLRWLGIEKLARSTDRLAIRFEQVPAAGLSEPKIEDAGKSTGKEQPDDKHTGN